MSVNRLKFHATDFTSPQISGNNTTDVRLYGVTNVHGTAHIGNSVPEDIERLSASTSVAAFDFLSIALAVTAADSFIPRSVHGEDGWARSFELEIPLVSPQTWQSSRGDLEKVLDFLSGDSWHLTFTAGGRTKPSVFNRRRRSANLAGVDCVSLFSGGLDSWIGVNDLLRANRVPVLVSHAYTGDRGFQNRLYKKLSGRAERFVANAAPLRLFNGHDTTMRTRSINFIALAVVAADAIARLEKHQGQIPLYVPENGFIALNAPLTSRRVGSLSTRTTHPHYLSELQKILDQAGVRAKIENPYRHKTKGRMLKDFAPDPAQAGIAAQTVSCGKWKRKSVQCGSCVPCIIRRAAFFAAGVVDRTSYGRTLQEAINHDNVHVKDDVMSMLMAAQNSSNVALKRRALATGPLPYDTNERSGWFDVHEQGLYEVAEYMRSQGLMT
ncbi:Qat anti-phage system QueC-like protein QatC [Rhizobium leguminosarum]|uniref:Qat anti-phage system QueC-like protein QatC n=1 Tax=Rhizobium leguminosarum TaxID=384 RepID=UPI0014421A15|nr:Qat anti-phage system QueC-like protein QatC [Rhizobium leguminosarum]NKN01171.1 hypothetical protein [Rhizobium leguminosarum bv. viciae]